MNLRKTVTIKITDYFGCFTFHNHSLIIYLRRDRAARRAFVFYHRVKHYFYTLGSFC